MQALLIFPHQLFESNARLARSCERIYLVEDALFFLQYRFHKQKLVLHRASMRAHADDLRAVGLPVHYVEFGDFASTLELFKHLVEAQVAHAHYIDVVDDWLAQRLQAAAAECQIALTQHRTPMFLSEERLLNTHFSGTKHPRMASFYADQRRQRRILMDGDAPAGGRWSFDTENRKKLPRHAVVPPRPSASTGLSGAAVEQAQRYVEQAQRYIEEAQRYIERHFAGNPGSSEPFLYPVTVAAARQWLEEFLRSRLPAFGDYEDAIAQDHEVLFHSLLSPLLNIGLLTPAEVIERALAQRSRVPINSLEGFVRQVVGWREYMRGAYISRGRRQRTRNFWHHSRPIPASFWSGTTRIAPLDAVIGKLLRCAYAHHIERLMVLANFMLLCEFHPDEVYRWFMEMFIDAYDWVMVPNVYGMALYADGGDTTTKPYISGSNYVLKMSDFKTGPWCAIWDALYWRFIDRHRQTFAVNQRTRVLVMGLDRMPAAKRALHLETAEDFLQKLT